MFLPLLIGSETGPKASQKAGSSVPISPIPPTWGHLNDTQHQGEPAPTNQPFQKIWNRNLVHLRPHLHNNKYSVYPDKLKFILVKISPDSEILHGKHIKENQTLVTFLTAGNLSSFTLAQIRIVLIFVQLCCLLYSQIKTSDLIG